MTAERKVKSTMQTKYYDRMEKQIAIGSDYLIVTNHQHFETADNHSSSRRDGTLQVFVRDNNVDQALRVLKKKMQREGIFRELKRRRFFEKPSERSAREKAEAVRRARKLARKQAIREGLIAAPKKVSQPGVSSPVRARGLG